MITVKSVPCAQQRLRHVYTGTHPRVHMASSIKMVSVDSETVFKTESRENEVNNSCGSRNWPCL